MLPPCPLGLFPSNNKEDSLWARSKENGGRTRTSDAQWFESFLKSKLSLVALSNVTDATTTTTLGDWPMLLLFEEDEWWE